MDYWRARKRVLLAFLEDAAGARYSPQLPHNRALAGCWLAEKQLTPWRTISSPASRPRPRSLPALAARLPGHVLRHLDDSGIVAEDATVFRNIAAHSTRWNRCGRVGGNLRRDARTLVHGDFVNKNLRIRDAAPACAAGIRLGIRWLGVPAADLAQLMIACRPDLDSTAQS